MQLFWRLVASFLASHPREVDWLIHRAQRTPYSHITSADGQSIYMGRWWLFNPYSRGPDGEQTPARFPWLPSVRIHHICRADLDRHLHDHPWNARTIVLRGWYTEERAGDLYGREAPMLIEIEGGEVRDVFLRHAGYTGRLRYGQYHRIREVSADGVWTLFITGRKRGSWGFKVDGQKVPWREYLGLDKGGSA